MNAALSCRIMLFESPDQKKGQVIIQEKFEVAEEVSPARRYGWHIAVSLGAI
jgi:hypothetical protein